MALQPALRHLPVDLRQGPFKGAQEIHERGLFIGAHARSVDQDRLVLLVDAVMGALEA